MVKAVYWYNNDYLGGIPVKAIDDRDNLNSSGQRDRSVTRAMVRKGFKLCPDQDAAARKYEEWRKGQADKQRVDSIDATPGAVEYAKEKGIDLATVPGALEGKRITKHDLVNAEFDGK